MLVLNRFKNALLFSLGICSQLLPSYKAQFKLLVMQIKLTVPIWGKLWLNSACAHRTTLKGSKCIFQIKTFRENVKNNLKDLLNNNIILNKLIKSNDKCNPCKDLIFFCFPSQEQYYVTGNNIILLETLKATWEEVHV